MRILIAAPRRLLLSMLVSVLALAAMPTGASSQSYPNRPIRVIVPIGAGGLTDIVARTVAERLEKRLGQPIVIENKPGAGGMLGADIVAKAKGDAHMIMMSSSASHGIGPVLYKDVPYDPLADFLHIHLVGTFPSVLAVSAESPIKTVRELVEKAKAKPGDRKSTRLNSSHRT